MQRETWNWRALQLFSAYSLLKSITDNVITIFFSSILLLCLRSNFRLPVPTPSLSTFSSLLIHISLILDLGMLCLPRLLSASFFFQPNSNLFNRPRMSSTWICSVQLYIFVENMTQGSKKMWLNSIRMLLFLGTAKSIQISKKRGSLA